MRPINRVPFNVRTVLHYMVDEDINQAELARRIPISKTHMSKILRNGYAGELTVLRLERLLWKDLRVHGKEQEGQEFSGPRNGRPAIPTPGDAGEADESL